MNSSTHHLWARRWLLLGVAALAVAGLFSLILVIARTPQLAAFKELFSVALVVHVDLSVLVWFVAMMCVGLSQFIAAHERDPLPVIQPAAWWSAALGTALITLSPLTGEWEVVKSNYIPVLFNGAFFFGLALFAAATLLVCLHAVWVSLTGPKGELGVMDTGWLVTALVLLVALFMFFLSGEGMPAGLPHEELYEILFWAGGHTLQFAYIMLMMLAWLLLASKRSTRPLLARKWLLAIWALVLGAAAIPLYAYLEYTVDDQAFINLFTDVMIEWGGVAPGILFVALLYSLLRYPARGREYRALGSSLCMSMVLFAAGGLLGLMIQGQNVTIPAHYHGAIVGVTLASMGYAYYLLPQLGYRAVTAWRLAYWQPITYGVGQLMHIGGLGYSGGYGVLRKTAAAGQDFAPEVKIALGIMGLGGLLAIIGGFMFVLVLYKAMRRA